MKKLLLLLLVFVIAGCSNQLTQTETPKIGVDPIIEIKEFDPDVRNFDKVQHEKLRKEIDANFNTVHDALSDAYYGGTEFSWKGTDYGILDKTTFDKLHGLIWSHYDVTFDVENKKQLTKDIISEADYNEVWSKDEEGETVLLYKKSEKAQEQINKLKFEDNLELEI